MTPEAQVEAVKAALAEAGYPRAFVVWGRLRDGVTDGVLVGDVPEDMVWRALVACDPDPENVTGCWPCFQRNRSTVGCTHDFRTEPWPEVVR